MMNQLNIERQWGKDPETRGVSALWAGRLLRCLVFLCLGGGLIERAQAVNDLPPGFSLIQVGGNATMEFPVAMAFAPDGRIFITEQKGTVRIIKNNQLLPQAFLTLNVHFYSERGLAGITFDPNFAVNGYVYVYYSAMTPTIHNRLSRFTANGDQAVPGSELVLIDLPTLGESGFHNSGCLKFGRDGKLYVSVGENNIPTNSQSLFTPMGKILRINGDGTIPTDNPFYNQTTGTARATYALGFRNPFTFDFQPGTGRFFVNDVGYSTWETVKEMVPGGNYGWPVYEGVSNDPNFKSPIVAYAHPPDPASSAITGGAFYNPPANQYPAQYVGKYFFMDGFTQWIRYIDLATYTPNAYSTNLGGLRTDANYQISEFGTNMTGVPLYLTMGPEGCLYYVAHIGGGIYKIQYSGQLAPQIGTQPSPQFVSVGYPAIFSVGAYGAQPLTYQWQRTSGGGVNFTAIPGANAPSYTNASPAVIDNGAQFRCVVANGSGSTNSLPAILTVTAASPPVATILTPADGATFRAGDVLSFTGHATDALDGELTPDKLTWWIDIHHLTHTHPFLAATNGFRSNSIAVPTLLEHDDRIWLRLHLQAVNSTGLIHSVYRDILPVKSTVTLATTPPGLTLRLDGAGVPTPTNFLVVAGVIHDLAADPQVIGGQVYQFDHWSQGGPAAQTINVPAVDTTYTAFYTPVVNGTDSAEFVSQTFLTFMIGNQNYDVTVTMKNNGTTIWTPGTYFLGSQNPDDNTNWGANRISLAAPVAPGDTATFNFRVTAPLANGTFNMQWRMFHNGAGFFGTPSLNVPVLVQVRGNAAAFISQSVPSVMTTGQRYSVSVTMRNAGTNTWTIEKKHRLSSDNPPDNATWGLSRAYLSNFVLTGNNVTFAFTVMAPSQPGQYEFQWRMLQEAVELFGEATPKIIVTVRAPGDSAAFISQSVPLQMRQGQTNPVTVVVLNDGTNSWPAGSTYKLSSQNPQDNTVWGIARVALAAPVAAGQNATFQFSAIAPTNAGTYNFQWRMIHEGVNVFGAVTPATAVDVLSGTNHATFVSQSVTNTMNPGLNYTVTVVMKNLSTNTWTTLGGYQLAAINPPDNLRWGANRVALNGPVPPGGIATLSFLVTAPNLGGSYPFQWQMVQDGISLFGQPSPVVNVTVLPPVNNAAFGSQSVPATMTAGLSYTVPITLTNTGSTLWTTASGFVLRAVNPVDNVTWTAGSVTLPATVVPGGTVTFNVPVVAPITPGTYNFQWQMSQDGPGFFGAPTPNVAVTVIPLVSDAAFVRQTVPSVMTTGLTYTVSLTMSNSGTSFWQPGDFQLASANPADNLTWGANRVALPATVAPGATATFAFQIVAPLLAGPYSFQWGMLKMGPGTFGTLSAATTVTVGSQSNAATLGAIAAPATMTAGLDYVVSVTATNTGTTTWSTNDFFELVSQNTLTNQTWGVSRLPVLGVIAPGQTVTFNFTVTAPVPVGSYNFQWQLRQSVLGLFGSPSPNRVINVTAVGNASRFVSQTVATNMIPGAHYPVVIRMRNIGTNTWSELTRHRLGAINPAENGNWGSARQVLSAPVPPGAEGVFSFSATGPLTIGTYNFQWRTLQEGVGYFGDSTPNVVVAVADGLNNAGYVSQSVPAAMNTAQTYPITITLTNTGTTTWTSGSLYYLASQNPADNLTWGLNRVTLPASVPPATAVTFSFNVTAPVSPGTYNLQWRMLQAGLGLFGAVTPNVTVVVSTPPAGNDAGFVAQSVANSMFVGQSYPVSVTMTNSGGTTWAAETFRLRSQNPVDGTTWGLGSVALGAPVVPGAVVTFNFNVTAPVTPGVANFQWQMSQDGSGFFGAVTPNVPVAVVLRTNDAGFRSLNLPGTMTTGQVASASVTMTNLGTTTWTVGAYRLGSLNPTNTVVWGTNRVELVAPVAPGAMVTLTFPITAPAVPGLYDFQWQMVEEATGFFGAATPSVSVSVIQPTDGASFGSQSVAAAMNVGQTYPVTVVMTNTGNTTWLPGSYRLGSQNPTANVTWGVSTAALSGAVVPGGIGAFSFTVTPPGIAGSYNFQWQMLHDGVGYFGSLTPAVPVTVSVVQDNAGFVSQTVAPTMSAGVVYPIAITMTNTGGSVWTTQGGYALAPQNPLDNSVWSSNRLALPVSVAPGVAVTFNFTVFAPAVVGTYDFRWQMVQGVSAVFGTATPNVAINVTSVGNAARFISQSVPTNMLPGTRYSVAVVMRNTGTNTWSELAKYRLSVQNPQDNAFWGVRRAVLPANVGPGQDGVFVFNVTSPTVQTQYPFQWRMLLENIAYFGDYTPTRFVNVTNSFDSASFLAQSVPGAMNAGQAYPVSITLTNDGTTTWSAGANYRLVAQNPAGSTNWGVVQVALPGSVARSNTVTLAFNVTAPSVPGTYNFQWQMMRDNAVFGAVTPVVPVSVVGNTDAAGFLAQNVPNPMIAGQTYPVSVTLTNTGNTTWSAGANYRLGAQSPAGNATWGFATVVLPVNVPPGGIATFNFNASAPASPGGYNWQWQMQHDATYFGALTPLVVVNVIAPVDDAVLGVPSLAAALNIGLPYVVTLRATNSGTTTWDPNLGYALVAQNPQSNSVWNVSRVALPGVVDPGQSVTLSFSVTAPTNAGLYDFQWQMVRGGVGLFGTPTVDQVISVQVRGNDARFVFQSVPAEMIPGLSYPISVRMRNAGTNVWSRFTGHKLASQNPLSNTNWGFVRILLPVDVPLGVEAVLQFNVTAPAVAGTYEFQTQMIQDAVELFGERTPDVSVVVRARGNAARFVSQDVPANVITGVTYPVVVRMLNVGTNAWTVAGNYFLTAQNPLGSTNWGTMRIGVSDTVLPGAVGIFTFNVAAPAVPGFYNFQWEMLQDGVELFGDLTPNLGVTVAAIGNSARFVSQLLPTNMMPTFSYPVTVRMQNTGTNVWSAGASYRLLSVNPPSNGVWTVASVVPRVDVLPGAEVGFDFTVVGPSVAGDYGFQWQMSQDGVGVFGDLTVNQTVTVRARGNSARFVAQSVPSNMVPGLTYQVTLRYFNTGTNTWNRTGFPNYSLASQNPLSNLVWGPGRIPLPGDIAPGTEAVVDFNVTAPAAAGIYNFQYQLVNDGVELFGDKSPNLAIRVEVPTNDAVVASQSVSATMLLGQTYPVSVAFTNSGNTIWTDADGYAAVSLSPAGNSNWGTNRLTLTAPVPPGGVASFAFNVSAPAAPTVLNFQWQMAQTGAVFGAASPLVAVSVEAPLNAAAFVGQVFPLTLRTGVVAAASLQFRNTGNLPWTPGGGYYLKALSPEDNSFWGTNRVAVVAPVQPGQTGTFSFNVTAPLVVGPRDFQWRMAQDGSGAFGEASADLMIALTAPVDNSAFVTQTVASVMVTGQTYNVSIRMRNTGDTTWTAAAGYVLAAVNPVDNTIWGGNRAVLPADTAPGQEVVFNFVATAPGIPNLYNFQWQMVKAGSGVFGVPSDNVAVTVRVLVSDSQFVSQSVPATMLTGGSYNVLVSFRNTGETTWDNATGFRLAAVNPGNDLVWGTNRVALAAPVVPGQTGVFALAFTAPVAAGPYDFRWQMNQEGNGLFGAVGTNVTVSVTVPVDNSAFVTQTVASVMVTGQTYNVSIRMRNTGDITWTTAAGYALAAMNPVDNTIWGGNRAVLPGDTAPGQEVVFNFVATAPGIPNPYNFQWQMVKAGSGVFGVPSDNVAVTVRVLVSDSQFVSQVVPATMLTGGSYNALVSFRNTGETTWDNATGFRLAAVNPGNDLIWGTNRVALAAPVVPGQTGVFALAFTAPVAAGPYDFRWQMTQPGSGLFGTVGSNVSVLVTVPVNSAAFVTQTVASVMVTGQTYNASIRMRNTGDTTWTTAAGYALAAVNPVDNTILGGNRAVLPGDTAPGQEVVFNFVATAPGIPNLYNFQWQMVKAGSGVFGVPSDNVTVTVRSPLSLATFVSQTVPTNLATGQTFNVSVALRNTGDTVWPAGGSFKLASRNPADNVTWGTNRVALTGTVLPGGLATFTFALRAPATAGSYNHQWQMNQEGVGGFGDLTPNVIITAGGAIDAATFVSQSVPAAMVGSQRYVVAVTMRNTGSTTWDPATKYKLSAQNPVDNRNWGDYRILLPAPVLPGGTVTFSWTVTAPSPAGNYNFQWRMMREGLGWFGQASANLLIPVSTPPNDASFVSQVVPATMRAGTTNTVTVTMRNTGTKTWTALENYRLGSQSPADNSTWGLRRVVVPASVVPGANAVFTFPVKAPSTNGSYVFGWKMIQEGVVWFGTNSPNVTITVGP